MAFRAAPVAILLLLAACSGDGGGDRAETIETTAPVPDDTAADATSIDGIVLTLDDMPPGYSPAPSDDDETEAPPFCAGVEDPDTEPTDKITGETFAAGQTGPFILSVVASYPDAATASVQLDRLLDVIEECDNMMDLPQGDGGTIQLTVSPLSFNPVGDRTIAFRGVSDDGPAPVTFDQVSAQVGNVLIAIAHVTSFDTAPDAELTEQLLTTMVERVD